MGHIEMGWKVVTLTVNDEYMCSPIMNRNNPCEVPIGIVIYDYGVWVKPNEGCGPLSVFKHRVDALTFLSNAPTIVNKGSWSNEAIAHDNSLIQYEEKTYLVLPCKYIRSVEDELWIKHSLGVDNKIKAFKGSIAKGTVFADEVMLCRQ